jgi:DNA-binding transcriptional regulator GbsR (MarR family)
VPTNRSHASASQDGAAAAGPVGPSGGSGARPVGVPGGGGHLDGSSARPDGSPAGVESARGTVPTSLSGAEGGERDGRDEALTGLSARADGADGAGRDDAAAELSDAGHAGAAGTDGGERDEAAVSQFIERFAGVLFDSGVPRMPARVFVALLTADAGQLTAAELGEILGVSPAAVSGGVRYLIQVGLVTGTGAPGSRRLYYSVPHDVWHRLLRMRDQLMARWTETLREGARIVGAGTAAGERLTESVEYFEFMAAELPAMLERWDEHRAARRRPS